MGRKNKNKSKAKTNAPVEVSEADAAAGLMTQAAAQAVAVSDKVKEETNEESKKKHDSKRAREQDGDGEEQKPLSRRQKRQKLNDKNKWPQHPKIMNPEKRAKAYLRVAGVEEIGEDDTEIPVQEEPVVKKKKQSEGDKDDEEWRRFGRFLGGTDARMRHKAVKRLGHYLKAKSGFGQEDCSDVVGLSELDLMKLWKGLWYTLYMADKAPVQDELAKHLSKLVWCLTGSLEEDEQAGQAFLDWQAEEEMEMERQMAIAQERGEDGSDDSEEEDDDDVKILETRFVEMDDDASDNASAEEKETVDSEESQEREDDSEEEEEESEDKEKGNHEHKNGCCGSDDYDEDEKTIRGIPLVMLMFKTFYKTLVREWGNMDKYRVDKFYSLVRYMMREMYRYMALRQWNLGIIKLLNDTIFEEVLTTTPNGIRYHLIDIALEELSHIVHKSECLPVTEAIFLEVMEPFFLLAQHGAGDKSVQARTMEKVLEKFLKEYSIVSDFDDEREDQQKQKSQILNEVHVGTVADFIFRMASDENTLDIHRKSLYDMHKQYKRQLKKIGKDVEMNNAHLFGDKEGMDEADEDAEHDAMELQKDEGNDSEESEKVVEPTAVKSRKLFKKEICEQQEKHKSGRESSASVSKKEKKKKKNKSNDDYEMQMDWTRHGNGDGDVSRKSHKKKNKMKIVRQLKQDDPEETLTISVLEQKKAKKALKEEQDTAKKEDNVSSSKQSKKQKKKDKKKIDEEKKRRVSWDTKNQARSWKASMQGLKTMQPPKAMLASKSPDKSILLNKGKKSPTNTSAVTQKQRKRAVDYF